MEIKIEHGNEMLVSLKGRLDTTTSFDLDKALKQETVNEELMAIDFKELDYISSAGLRLLLALKKQLNAEGKELEIRNINDVVKEVFTVTGFINILKIK